MLYYKLIIILICFNILLVHGASFEFKHPHHYKVTTSISREMYSQIINMQRCSLYFYFDVSMHKLCKLTSLHFDAIQRLTLNTL